jgi:hypothetical protein
MELIYTGRPIVMPISRTLQRDRRGLLEFLRAARKDATAELASMAFALGAMTLVLYLVLPLGAFAICVAQLDTGAMLAAGAIVKVLRQRRSKWSRQRR